MYAVLALSESFWTGVSVALVGAVGGVVVALAQKPSRDKAKAVAAVAADIKAQVVNNGGTSMKDAIDRIDKRTETFDSRFSIVDNRQLLMEKRQLSTESILQSLHDQVQTVLHANNEVIVPEIRRLTNEVQHARETLGAHVVTPTVAPD